MLNVKQKVAVTTIHTITSRSRLLATGDLLTQVNVGSILYIKVKRSMSGIVHNVQ